ncbi:hypothetical protein IMZ48_42595 [Candidatus Bathyarchaeota archaeon]|nr:hypothetical protein [Candidatus Bathyarchaeota archaeon]
MQDKVVGFCIDDLELLDNIRDVVGIIRHPAAETGVAVGRIALFVAMVALIIAVLDITLDLVKNSAC